MAGSEAEERIRAKVVEAMRRRWPDGRIIHELNLEQFGTRLDLACVTPDTFVVAEIKSERDVLKRAAHQLELSVARANTVWFVVNEKHAPAVRDRLLPSYIHDPEAPAEHAWKTIDNPDRIKALRYCDIFTEKAQDAGLWPWSHERWTPPIIAPGAQFDLLWAPEMRSALGRHFGGALIPETLTRPEATRQAVEHMSGREIRRAVCTQLRNRTFPRADAPANQTADAKPLREARLV